MNERFIPVFIKTSDLKIIVFGGGNVALRKCKYFRGAKITVVSKSILPDLQNLASRIIVGEVPGDVKSMIRSYNIVIAATDSKTLNDAVRDDALSMGISVNSAHGGGNVLIPSVLKRDRYVVAVSSEGHAPTFSQYMVKRLNALLDGRYDRMLDFIIEMRNEAKKRIGLQSKRREFLESMVYDEKIQSLVENGSIEKAKTEVLKRGEFIC